MARSALLRFWVRPYICRVSIVVYSEHRQTSFPAAALSAVWNTRQVSSASSAANRHRVMVGINRSAGLSRWLVIGIGVYSTRQFASRVGMPMHNASRAAQDLQKCSQKDAEAAKPHETGLQAAASSLSPSYSVTLPVTVYPSRLPSSSPGHAIVYHHL